MNPARALFLTCFVVTTTFAQYRGDFTFPVQTLGEVVADKSAGDQAAIQTALADIQAKS